MTYTDFLLLFLFLPLMILVGFFRDRLLNRRFLAIAGVLTLVSLVYMAPWDHFAAIWGLWSWENSRTSGIRWWTIPPEEYLFCVLESLLAITLTFTMLNRNDRQKKVSISKTLTKANADNTNFAPPPESIPHNKTIAHASLSPVHNEKAGRENAK